MVDAMIWKSGGVVHCSVNPGVLSELKDGDEWHLVRVREIAGTKTDSSNPVQTAPANPQES